MPDDYDADRNSFLCWELGLRATREMKIRRGEIEPSTPEEIRWAEDGPCLSSELDTVKNEGR